MKMMEEEGASYPALRRAFARYCDGLKGPINLCGLSLGAVLALDYAAARPGRVCSLVLIGGRDAMPSSLLKGQDLIFRLMPRRAFGGMGLTKGQTRALAASMARMDLSGRPGAVRCPALVVCGARDWANRGAAFRLARGIPGAKLRLIPGAGHEVNREAPDALARALRHFYGGLTARG